MKVVHARKESPRPAWKVYQDEVAAFFCALGLEAGTDQTLHGVRTTHDIDVVVRSSHLGFDLLWVVECKKWKAKVKKRDVMALREIVSDLGADRGFLMAERGYQTGAFEAAQLTNVQLATLEELQQTTAPIVSTAGLRNLLERIDACTKVYWEYSKSDRIRFGLRPDSGAVGYSAQMVLRGVKAAVDQALLGHFPPIPPDAVDELAAAAVHIQATNLGDLLTAVEPHVSDVERRLELMQKQSKPRK